MLLYVSKTARYFAFAYCFAGISGCASDGGMTELAMAGSLLGGAGVDTGTMAAIGAAAVGSMAVASTISDSAETTTPNALPSASVTAPATSASAIATKSVQGSTLADLVAKETVTKYQSRSCDYLHLSLSESDQLIASPNPMAKQVGDAKKSAVSQVFQGKNCPPLSPLLGRIGAIIDTVDPVKAPQLKIPATGVWIEGASPGSNAEKAGLSRGDVVVAVNDNPIEDATDFRLAVGRSAIGSTAKLKVWRAQRFYDAPVLVGQ
ncbi:PDZ domain-containing protein [Pseudomonas sp. HLS-6 TE3448]